MKPFPPSFLMSETQRKDRAFVLKVVSDFGKELEFADSSLRADPEIVLAESPRVSWRPVGLS
jgi:hypothetical protein